MSPISENRELGFTVTHAFLGDTTGCALSDLIFITSPMGEKNAEGIFTG